MKTASLRRLGLPVSTRTRAAIVTGDRLPRRGATETAATERMTLARRTLTALAVTAAFSWNPAPLEASAPGATPEPATRFASEAARPASAPQSQIRPETKSELAAEEPAPRSGTPAIETSPAAASAAGASRTETFSAGGTDAEPERLFEELLVIGSAEAARHIPGSAHFLSKEAVERQEYSDVHRVLRQIPGVNIQEEEGYGLRPNIGIRGTGVNRSEKITLMEDGVLIAPAPYSAPAAYYAPTAGRMESFEIRKGSTSIRQGPYTNGGTVNYVSTAIPGALRAKAELAAGGEGLRRAAAWVGDSGERWGWLFETFQLETDGFKRLDGGGNTGVDLEDYVGKLRFTSAPSARIYQAVEVKLGSTDQLGQETYLGLTADDFRADPYRRYAASQGDHIESDHQQFQVSYFAQPADRFSLTATAYRNDFFRNWFKLERVSDVSIATVLEQPADHPRELAILRGEIDSQPGELRVRNNRRDYYSEGIQAVLEWQLGPAEARHDLDVGVRFHRDGEDRFQEEDRFQMLGGRRTLTALGDPGSNANRIASAQAWAVFVQDTIARGRWTWSPGLRVESIDLERQDFGRADPDRSGTDLALRANAITEWIPGLGVNFRIDERTSLFGGLHRGFSPPSPSSTRDVRAEESLNFELGWRFRDHRLSAEAVGFFNDYDNLLGNDTVATGGEGTGDQFNGGKVRVHGLEASASFDLVAGRTRMPLRMAYTWTRGEFQESFETSFSDWAPFVRKGDAVPYIPEHQLFAGISLERERWAAHLDGTVTGKMRTRAGSGPVPESESIGSRAVFDLRTEFRVNDRIRLWSQILNLTDHVYVAGRRPAGLRPGRPRALLFGVRFDLARANR